MKQIRPLFAWLKEAVQNTLAVLQGILLIILALVLLAIAVPGSVIWYFATIWSKKEKARDIMRKSADFFYLVALELDYLGNVACGGFLSWLFLQSKSPFPFGVPGQSVSEILGFNFKLDNLTEWGLNLRHDLNTIDPDHCEKAMATAIDDAKQLLETYRKVQSRIDTIERTKEFLARY